MTVDRSRLPLREHPRRPLSPQEREAGRYMVKELLLPDRATWWDDPVMGEPLRPLADFDHPQLRRVDAPECDGHDPIGSLRSFMGKNCAGLRDGLRADPHELREAFVTGEFTTRQAYALDWAFSGMRVMWVFPGFIAGARLPIYEVARCFWQAFDGASYGTGPWLNQWAENPGRPHPSAPGGVRLNRPWAEDNGTDISGREFMALRKARRSQGESPKGNALEGSAGGIQALS